MTELDTEALQAQLPVVPEASGEAHHVGIDDVPWMPALDGLELQVLHVDLSQGLWVVRNRFAPGTRIDTHYHAGPVFAVTLRGEWFYEEYPDKVNRPGSYLFEPAGSVHTLTVPADQDGPTEVWFAIHGPNINLNPDRSVSLVVDASTAWDGYRLLCDAAGEEYDQVLVEGRRAGD